MKRKQFLLSLLAAVPVATLGGVRRLKHSTVAPFRVASGKSRFDTTFTYRGVNSQDLKVSSRDTAGHLCLLEYTGREKTGPPLHIHFKEDEIFYIAEGEYRFVVGDEDMTARSGDTIFLPRNIPHTWIQLTEKGKLIYMLQPSGRFEEFLGELQSLKNPPTEEELQNIHLAYGMKVLGPPLKL